MSIKISHVDNSLQSSTGVLRIDNTGALTLPVGTTGQQPVGATGMLRFNSTGTYLEYYDGSTWQTLLTTASPGAAAGNDTEVQYNSGGALAGDSGFTYNAATDTLTVAGAIVNGSGLVDTPSYTFTGDTDTGMSAATADTLVLSTNGTAGLTITPSQSVLAGGGQLANAATDGFLYVPTTTSGVPSGAPTRYTGFAPIVIDKTNNNLYFYSNGAWRDTIASEPAYQLVFGAGAGITSDPDFTYNNTIGQLFVNTTTGTSSSVSVALPADSAIFGVGHSDVGVGGNVKIQGGNGGVTSGAGGDAIVQGGSATSGAGGDAIVQGGSSADGDGGDVSISGAAGVGTNKNGGNVAITAGTATGSGTDGKVVLTGGNGDVFEVGASINARTAGATSFKVQTNGANDRFEITSTGEYKVAGSSGTAGYVIKSSGAGNPTVWDSIPNALGFTPADDSLVVHLAGTETITGNKSFTGTVNMTGSSSVTVPTPTLDAQAATKKYVDDIVASGIVWRDPIRDPDLIDVVSAQPTPVGTAVGDSFTYIKYGGTQNETWGAVTNVVDGDVLTFIVTSVPSTGTWSRLEAAPVTAGDRYIIAGEHGSIGSTLYGLGFRTGDLIQYVSGNPNLFASWSTPSDGGYQVIHFNTPKTASTVTPLVNATTYDLNVDINGTNYNVTVTADASYTYGELAADLTTSLNAAYTGASCVLESEGHFHIYSGDGTKVIISEGTGANPLLAGLGADFDEIRAGIINGTTVLCTDPDSHHYGHTYSYVDDTNAWYEISGPGSIGAGIGLSYSGNTLNLDLSTAKISGIASTVQSADRLAIYDNSAGSTGAVTVGTLLTDVNLNTTSAAEFGSVNVDYVRLDDTDSAFFLDVQSTSSLSANRMLTIDVDNGSRTLELGNNLIVRSTSDAVSFNVTSPTTGNVLAWDGTNWVDAASGSLTAPGSDTQVIFNDGGVFGADAGFTFDKATDTLTITSAAAATATIQNTTADGNLTIKTANSALSAGAGDIFIQGGNSTAATGGNGGGDVNLLGGDSNNVGGTIDIAGGAGTGAGGHVNITAGTGETDIDGSNHAGGHVTIKSGNGGINDNQVGDIRLAPGYTTANAYRGGDVAVYLSQGDPVARGGRFAVYSTTSQNLGGTELFAFDRNGEFRVGGSAGTATYALISNGAGAAPSWQSVSGLIAQPLNQLVYGSGTGITSTALVTANGAASNSYVIINDTTNPTGFAEFFAGTDNHWIDIYADESLNQAYIDFSSADARIANVADGQDLTVQTASAATGSAGQLFLTAGNGGSSDGAGGSVYIDAGTGGSTNGAGGQIQLTAGAGVGTGAGGSLDLTAGGAGGSGVAGNVTISGGLGGTDGNIILNVTGIQVAKFDGTTKAIALGEDAVATIDNSMVFANGNFATAGDFKRGLYMLHGTTANASLTELVLPVRLVLANNSSWSFDVRITGRDTTTGDTVSYLFQGAIKRGANAASTTIVGTVAETIFAEDDTSWSAQIDADTTNGSLRVQVTGDTTNTVRWVAEIITVEVTD